ncbi:Methyltransferase domain-containing protein [Polaribacter sp. KT25b]|uniref:class I SAM-dependent methyltransferase n=1 Tax=Polaribacter sp. KT25b TaxID=1855336 RepID=UPI00087959B9|nr:class I SAM-dependent methyltransferase [Polaribacter sp. KT25b]SDS12699.1 Methyltransferase domain-containing protein [Polaribacter sp. KT25b]
MTDSEKSIKKKKKPWPTKDAMEQIYELKLWGDNKTKFYSGSGSHQPEILNPYLDVVIAFLISFKNPITVCDLGCGDFNVGKKLVKHAKKLIAVDIVSELIDYNKEKFKEEKLDFLCLDIAKDDLPKADCVILRQVLQHLSNKEIKNIVHKLTDFKYVIITEHIPLGDFMPNKDIISGQGIRIKKQSGVNLLQPPFNLKIKREKELLVTKLKDNKGVIVTALYQNF